MDLNSVTLSGNLTRDPELRHTPSGASVTSLRVASNSRRKVGDEWKDVPGYFDVTVWGKRGEFVSDKLAKGAKVYLVGRLEWREWEAPDGSKRQAVQIVADNIESPNFWQGEGGGGSRSSSTDDFVPAAAVDDDIPF